MDSMTHEKQETGQRESPLLNTKMTSTMMTGFLVRVSWTPILPNRVNCEEFGGMQAVIFTVIGEEDDTQVNDEFYEKVNKMADDTDKKEPDKSAETDKLAGEAYAQEEVDQMLDNWVKGDNTVLPPPPGQQPGQNVSRTSSQLFIDVPIRVNDPNRQAY
jgi:hypothetical protein